MYAAANLKLRIWLLPGSALVKHQEPHLRAFSLRCCTAPEPCNPQTCPESQDMCASLAVGFSTVSVNNQTQMQKGCVSKSICDNAQNPALESLSIPLNITCCKGNLCNSAPRVGQSSFLLLFFLMPLPSIAFFR
ncbi:hypothetical protein JZ751_013489 [Albula glossodonta]|uniref:UPAR/Ly6 domain-containing protein n=1 Tax=Albula glossodonta TaxID=121402 RepID=A0A8T2MJG3_9TELE|nr:hypothetical protein JZ751_013489 [Albula glossodonta]